MPCSILATSKKMRCGTQITRGGESPHFRPPSFGSKIMKRYISSKFYQIEMFNIDGTATDAAARGETPAKKRAAVVKKETESRNSVPAQRQRNRKRRMNCKQCKEEFFAVYGNAEFCSDKCRKRFARAKKTNADKRSAK